MKRKVIRYAGPVLVAATVGTVLWVNAGSLTPPPGPIAPTMKDLDTVEPRVPISTLPFTINQSGSYYLTRELTAPLGQHGITIEADNVTLDLSGYTLVGVAGALNGIQVGNRTNISVLNGTIRGWGGRGVNASFATNSLFEGLRVSDNGAEGIVVGGENLIGDCAVRLNGNDGISASAHCAVTDCVAWGNAGDGIVAAGSSTIAGCIASSNNDIGIVGGGSGVIISCIADDNNDGGIVASGMVINSSAYDNGSLGLGAGIDVTAGSTVTGCNASLNVGDGIIARGGCRITGNTCDKNGNFGDGAGILAIGGRTHIDENTVTNNDRGIDVNNAGNIITRNSATGNTINYDIAGGNDVGPIGSAAVSPSPWANLAF